MSPDRRTAAEAGAGGEASDRPAGDAEAEPDSPVFVAPSDLLDHRAEEEDLMARSLLGL